MSLYISDSCIGCAFCQNECPTLAISYGGDRYAIDPSLCIRCGTCSRVCLMDAIRDSEAIPPQPIPHQLTEKSCDLLVVGGGAAGLVAAARYAQLTGKRVIVLEKNRKPGGGGYFAVGMMISNSQWERDAGIPDQVEQQVAEAMAMSHNRLNPDLLRNLFTSVGEFYDWLCSWAPVEKCFDMRPNPRTGKLSVGTRQEGYGGGKFITTHILPLLKKLGVEILTQTAATDLLLGENRQMQGVLARDPGGAVKITCSQCLLATGSLIRSQRIRELVPEFAQAQPKRYAHDMPGLTGDALTMAEQAGITLNTDSITLAFVGSMPVAFEQGAFQQGERKDAIKVNLEGRRYCNEDQPNFVLSEHLMYQPKALAYTLTDASILESDQAKAPPPPGFPPMPDFPYPGGVPDFAKTRRPITPKKPEAFRELAATLTQPQQHPVILYAETLEDMARQMGADPAELTRTVAHYNDLCTQGKDTDFGKAPQLLRPLERGPYVAILNYLYLDGVFGGLSVTSRMQVFDRDGVVPGLYAAGDIACGRYTNDRLHKREVINDFTWALTGGFMAATAAAEPGKH